MAPEQLRAHINEALRKADEAAAALIVSMHELRIVEVALNLKHPCSAQLAGAQRQAAIATEQLSALATRMK